jgi:Putative adhesin
MYMIRVSSLLIACAAFASAQDKVTVPLSNPSQPATVKVHLISGSITVTGGSGSQVVVESGAGSRESRAPRDVPPGMHRLDAGRTGMDVEEDHNVVNIEAGRNGGGANLAIQVPANSSLQLQTMNGGHIEVSGVSGEMDIENMNGSIELKNVSGSVVAHSLNGAVTATIDRVTSNKAMAFTSMNGKIEVTLPADTKARLRLKTDNGSVYSDFDVKMEPDATKPVVEDSRGQGGKYRIKLDRSVYGSINGGGPEYRFETLNGSILIHKK